MIDLFVPKLKIINIASELMTINKLAFVNEISMLFILISGPTASGKSSFAIKLAKKKFKF